MNSGQRRGRGATRGPDVSTKYTLNAEFRFFFLKRNTSQLNNLQCKKENICVFDMWVCVGVV